METLYALSGIIKLGAILLAIKFGGKWIAKVISAWKDVK